MPCTGVQVQPNCCDCAVAFDSDRHFMVGPRSATNCLGNNYVLNFVDLTLTEMKKYKLLFCGPADDGGGSYCGQPFYQYTTAQKNKLKDWVLQGGRLFAAAEWIGCFDQGNVTLHPNMNRFNDFLGFLGSAMQMTTNAPLGCDQSCGANLGVLQPQPIVTGLPWGGVRHSNCGQVTGGTELCRISNVGSPTGCVSTLCFFAAEYIGNGIVFAAIDSNLTAGCPDPNVNCPLFQRMCQWEVNTMLT